MRRGVKIFLFSTFLFFLPIYIALADVITNPEWPTTPQPFSFTCGPYLRAFEDSFHYLPDKLTTCYFTIPQTKIYKVMATYKGVVGDATFVDGGFTANNPYSKFRITPAFFGTPQTGDDFFSAAYSVTSSNELASGDIYMRTGEGIPPDDLTLVRWKWGPKPANEFDPVIIIPGILGSWEKDGKWILDPITHIYDNLSDTLIANGYVEGQTLFKFPYDWHNSNVVTAQLLEHKIDEIKEICGCLYVDLVAHSMGGLVATQYMKEVATSSVDQAFYLGVPFTGSPFAYQTWEGGEVEFADTLFNLVATRIFNREARDNNFGSIFEYLHNKPVTSVQELLPIHPNYLGLAGSNTALIYPNGYPRNLFLEELNANEHSSKIFNSARHVSIIGNIGLSSTTVGYLVQPSTQLPKWEHGEPTFTYFGEGDGTVPFDSSIFLYYFEKQFSDTNHNQLVSKSSGYIFKQLNNKEPDIVIEKTYDVIRDADYKVLLKKVAPSKGDFRYLAEIIQTALVESAFRSVLFITLFSPIEVEVIAPDGTVFNTSSEQEYLMIPDPTPGEYKVNAVGTGSGTYTIAASYIDVASTTEALADGNISTGQVSEYTLTIGIADRTVNLEPKLPISIFSGFLQPINTSQPYSVFKAGSTVPVKFQLKNEDGEVVQAATTPTWLEPQKGAPMSAAVGEVTIVTAGTIGNTFRWNATSQQYIYNWSTKGLVAGYWYLISALVDDITYSATVGLR